MANKRSFPKINKIMKIIFQYKKLHVLAFFVLLICVALSVVQPYLTMQIIDNAITNNSVSLLLILTVSYVLITVIYNLLNVLSEYIYSLIGKKVIFNIRFKIIQHIFKLSGEYFTNIKTGEVMSRLQTDISLIEEVATKLLFKVITDIFMSVGMIIFLAGIQPHLLILVIVIQPIMIVIQYKHGKRAEMSTKDFVISNGKLTAILQETISALLNIISFKGKDYFISKYLKSENDLIKSNIKLQMTFSVNGGIVSVLSSFITALILCVGGINVISGAMSIGGLVAFNLYSQRLLAPIMRIAQSGMRIQQSLVAIDRIYEILDYPILIDENITGCKPNSTIDSIKFENVYFGYEEQNNILENINMLFIKGSKTAVVGASGSGKTTISNLLLRFWDVTKGNIYINNTNIKEYNLEYYRKSISIVSQDTFLFNDTITNNLLLGDTVELDKILDCCKKADAYDFIMQLPNQFETMVGERGIKLSGGQKQRISLARALLRDTPIIILDEATSSLDNAATQFIHKQFRNLFTDKIVIIISHKLSVTTDADMIYVLGDGTIKEHGTHNELMNLRTLYYDFYTSEKNDKESSHIT